mmetsp:Transcript_20277/g.26263  ORF Transcript_20277/g.26263 Transcript_20277/m.26263 type:complete len:420 (-) Transcript_20277:2754-4013(-)
MTDRNNFNVTIAILISISLGALNSVLVKIKSDELQIYDGLVSGVMNAIGYCALYWPMLYLRWYFNIVPTEHIKFMFLHDGTKRFGAQRFIIAGGLADETGQILSAVAQPYVSIVASTLLSQTSSLWTMVTSASLLDARYTLQEFIGVGIALSGASIEIFAIEQGSDRGTKVSMAALILLAAIAPAFSFALKEKCFRLWRKNNVTQPLIQSQANQNELDVWVVASAAGLWSFIWAPFVCIVTAYIKKPNHMALKTYVDQAFACFVNRFDYADKFLDDDDDGDARFACTHAWQWWTIYMIINVLYNISIYRVVRLASALTSFVAGKLVAPVAILLTLAPWPVIGNGVLKPIQILSLIVILLGVAIFRHGTMQKDSLQLSKGVCCWPLGQWYSTSTRFTATIRHQDEELFLTPGNPISRNPS